MPRPPTFQPTKRKDGWSLNVPASMTTTGKRERRFFSSRDQARQEAEKLRRRNKEHGLASKTIRQALAEDAVAAASILEPYGITLTQAARHYASLHDRRGNTPTLAEAWEQSMRLRVNHAKRTQHNLRQAKSVMPEWLMKEKTIDIKAEDIKKAIIEITTGSTRRENLKAIISYVFGDLVRQGVLESNPTRQVLFPRKRKTKGVTIYTPEQMRDLMDACRDYDEGHARSCADCAAAFALMAFAGIRPDEIERLRWEKIDLERMIIKMDMEVTKRNKRRIVRVHPTLAAWLEMVPMEKRFGKVTPASWTAKAKRVRREAGIDGAEMQDALRHSFGSYLLALENGDIGIVGQDMGHAGLKVYLEHYHEAVTKAEAIEFFSVLPQGVKVPLIKAVR